MKKSLKFILLLIAMLGLSYLTNLKDVFSSGMITAIHVLFVACILGALSFLDGPVERFIGRTTKRIVEGRPKKEI